MDKMMELMRVLIDAIDDGTALNNEDGVDDGA